MPAVRFRAAVERDIFGDVHDEFRRMAHTFAEREVQPHLGEWERQGHPDRSLFAAAGRAGLLGLEVDQRLGGGGISDFRFNAILSEELCSVGATAVAMSICGFNDLVGPYLTRLCTPSQAQRWLPGLCRGEQVAALAMTEPGAGSDLKSISTVAVRDGDHFVLNGSKTFISNGGMADLVIVVAKTDREAGSRGMSLIVVEAGTEGFARGRTLDKIGLRSQDTAELFFTDVRVPVGNLLGEPGEGFGYLMANLPQERLHVAVMAAASLRRMLDIALVYTSQRQAFGQAVADFQANRFVLAELATEVAVAQTFVDSCIQRLCEGRLTPVDAAMAKWWVTELQQKVASKCLQLHGGYGYMREYDIAREFLDARASTLYAGTTEIMKEIIGRSLRQPPSRTG